MKTLCTLVTFTALGITLPGLTMADAVPRVANPLYTQECAGCHVPYPPALLPAASWNAVMDGLGNHFGSDASLDEPTSQRLRQFLVNNASQRTRNAATKLPLRITETRWFVHEHQEELPAGIWKNPAVKSAANCGACHTRAAEGFFDEDDIRLPKGVTRK